MPHRIARLTGLSALALLAAPSPLWAQSASAQPGAISLYTEAEARWAAPDAEAGEAPEPGLVLTQRSGGAVASAEGPLSLRARFALERSFALSANQGEGLVLEGEGEGELALGDDLVLRGGFSLSYREQSDALVVLGQPIATRGTDLALEADLGLVQRFGATRVAIAAGIGAERKGDTEFIGAALAPQRLEPRTDRLFANLSLEHALGPGLALLARAQADRLGVPVLDTLLYGRLPVDRVRASAGLRARPDPRVVIEFEAGGELLFGPALGDQAIFRPYGYGALGLTLRDGLTLNVTAQAGMRLDDPADGLADWRWRLDAEGAWQIAPRLVAFASLHGEGGQAVLAPVSLVSEWGGEAGVRFTLAPGVTLAASLARTQQGLAGQPWGPGETRLALALRTTL